MSNSKLISPHGSDELIELLVKGNDLVDEKKRAEYLPKITITGRESIDLVMMGIGAYTPLTGFMNQKDWRSVCMSMKMPSRNGLFWPIPITVSASKEEAGRFKVGTEISLYSEEFDEIMATMKIEEMYEPDKEFECLHVFKTTDQEHPGVKMVMDQKEINLAGPVKVLSEGPFPKAFKGIYQAPAESRKIFEEKGWITVAAFQLRNPMHRSHEYVAKIAVEVCDGLYLHQLVGNLKPGDLPADVRVDCINALVDNYFVKDTVVTGGYPLDMRYAGPREALFHALFRQNYGCSHIIIGRDHAGVGNYYGGFDAQDIFDDLWEGALLCKPLKIDWTFWCNKCGGMASMKTCPHTKDDRLLLSGTMLRKSLSEGKPIPEEFSRGEVVNILRRYYSGLTEKTGLKINKAPIG